MLYRIIHREKEKKKGKRKQRMRITMHLRHLHKEAKLSNAEGEVPIAQSSIEDKLQASN